MIRRGRERGVVARARALVRDEAGQGTTEYAILVGVLVVTTEYAILVGVLVVTNTSHWR